MLRDEYNRLMGLFAQNAEGKTINLDEIFKQSLVFFNHLSTQLKNGSQDEQKEALMMMSELYTQMLEQTKKICEKTGMSEAQLVAFADNPSNFSPEQWQALQEAKNKMLHAGKDLAKSVSDLHPPKKVASAEPSEVSDKKKNPSSKKTKKSQWKRS